MIDLLDLYIHHLATTHVGPEYPLAKFMNLQIGIRRVLRDDDEDIENEIPAMRDPTAGDRGTVRFILDWERVAKESEILEGLERWFPELCSRDDLQRAYGNCAFSCAPGK